MSDTMSKTLLSLRGVTKNFAEVEALKHIDLEIHSGEIVGLVGSNGAGKTTLLRLMAGVYTPSNGRVELSNGRPVEEMRQVGTGCDLSSPGDHIESDPARSGPTRVPDQDGETQAR